jgi:hypothetical protein
LLGEGEIKMCSSFQAFVIEPNTVDSYGFIVCGKTTGVVTVLLTDQNLEHIVTYLISLKNTGSH